VIGTVAKDFAITLPKKQTMAGIRVLARYDDPHPAPIAAGDVLGEVLVERDGRIIARTPLVAQNKVSKTQFFGRVIRNISVLFGIN